MNFIKFDETIIRNEYGMETLANSFNSFSYFLCCLYRNTFNY
jgi:hypothetical protein